ncbi:MAG TPA: ornithine cyclodeaminase family protein [Thermoanaerobaculia bacterium]
MSALVLSAADVRRLLPMATAIDLMASALERLARGGCRNPLRWGLPVPEAGGLIGMMPGYLDAPRALGIKVLALMPGNHGTPYDTHQGVVLLFDPDHGFPIAIADAGEVTAVRTAAVSGLATRLLARDDAGDLAILGTGVQARSHLAAMRAARELRRVRVYSRDAERRRAFARAESERHGLEVEAAPTAAAAVAGADLVCTVTSSREPVLMGEWLSPGVHVNAAGSSIAAARELDTAAVVRSRLFVDRRESTFNEAGDFLIPKREGAVDDDHVVAELGEILTSEAAGRRSPDEITLFKSLGLAVEDLAAVRHVYERAVEEGLGTRVELGEAGPGADGPGRRTLPPLRG